PGRRADRHDDAGHAVQHRARTGHDSPRAARLRTDGSIGCGGAGSPGDPGPPARAPRNRAGAAVTAPAPAAHAAPRTRRVAWLYVAVTALAMTGVAAGWQVVARHRLDAAVIATATEQVDRARSVFDGLRARTVAGLMSECRVLVEDPRLK